MFRTVPLIAIVWNYFILLNYSKAEYLYRNNTVLYSIPTVKQATSENEPVLIRHKACQGQGKA